METSEEHLEGMWGRGFTSDASTIHAEILIRDTKTYYNAKKKTHLFSYAASIPKRRSIAATGTSYLKLIKISIESLY